MNRKSWYAFLFVSLYSFSFPSIMHAQQPATVTISNNQLSIVADGKQLFKGILTNNQRPYRIQNQHQLINGAFHQIITITAGDFAGFELKGTISGTNEAIACESEPHDGSIKLVRNSVGPSRNLRNNAIYDRQKDWLLSFDANSSRVTITPADSTSFDVAVKGWEMVIRFRLQYYQKHRGLSYFNPTQYSIWKKPIVGWCSWFAYFDKVTEKDVEETTSVLSEKLRPFGLEYVQVDDGYQQVPIGLPNTWLQTNNKFPSGLSSLAAFIKSKGMEPGIWTNVSFADSVAAYKNASLFVKDKNNHPALGNWVGYVMDGSNSATVQQLIAPVYGGLKTAGWQYYKLDALRHLKYEGYNSYQEYFAKKAINRNEAFRNIVKEVRKQIGKENFLLACWGIRPELVGIADGCRIGNDGYSYAGLTQFNSYNNIIWRNDPDHIVLSKKEAYRSCTATSLSGSLFMLTDKSEVYKTSGLIEAARRSIPVLFTQPGQVYDIDPSVSSKIGMADIELSGSGPRPFDASSTSTTGLFALEINRPFENWMLLGRLDERDKLIPFADLGLDTGKEYLVFEFWSKQFMGVYKKELPAPLIDTNYNCQVFCIRQKMDHPQVLATNRHIGCGGLELKDVQWKNNRLSGNSELVPGDNYMLYLYEPGNYTLGDINVRGAHLVSDLKEGNIRKITLTTQAKETTYWSFQYK